MEENAAKQLGPLLVKAGNFLAPNHFTLALDGPPLSLPPPSQDIALDGPSAPLQPSHQGTTTTAPDGPSLTQLPKQEETTTAPDVPADTTTTAQVEQDGLSLPNVTITMESSSQSTSKEEELKSVDSDTLDALAEKGKKLQRYQFISQCAQNHLSELGSSDAHKRCVVISTCILH